MSGGGAPSYQAKTGSLEVKIIVRYEGLKATQYFSKFTPQSNSVLREDLLCFKLPHPKRENITFMSHGCVECVWPSVPKNGLLHKQIMSKSRPQNPDERRAFTALLARLSISTLVSKEIYPDFDKRRKNLKRPNPFTSNEVEEGSSAGLRRSGRNVYRRLSFGRTETENPHGSATPTVAEAEAFAFLQDVRDSFRAYKIPKIEPVEVPLPPAPHPTRLVRDMRGAARSTSSPSSHLSSVSKATNPPESVSSLSPLVGQKPLHATVTSHTYTSPSKPPPATMPTSDLRKTIMPLPNRPAPIQDMLRELQPLLFAPRSLPEPAQQQFPVSDTKMMSITPIPAPQASLEVTTVTNSRPKGSDILKIQRLTRESCDIRRQITADTVRDAAIISELQQLNSAFIPRPSKVIEIADTAMEGRIKKLEQDLETEKKMRLEAEDVIRDIRRECKAPFVVPGLLDAFIKLSKLTTQATRSNGTIPKDSGRTI